MKKPKETAKKLFNLIYLHIKPRRKANYEVSCPKMIIYTSGENLKRSNSIFSILQNS